jgi:transposase
MMDRPQEIVDEEHEQVCERVAAIDVAKATGMVCVRVPDDSRPGRRVSRVWEVQATTRAVIELGDHLACEGIEKVTLESTSLSGVRMWTSWTLPRSCRGGRVCDGGFGAGRGLRVTVPGAGRFAAAGRDVGAA